MAASATSRSSPASTRARRRPGRATPCACRHARTSCTGSTPDRASGPTEPGMPIQATVPVLASLDIGESEDFHVAKLGFTTRLREATYLIVEREGCELHFWRCDERHIAENTSCYVRADTRALHADFAARGLRLDPPQDRDWGMREFYVIDPHGNLLKFGEPL